MKSVWGLLLGVIALAAPTTLGELNVWYFVGPGQGIYYIGTVLYALFGPFVFFYNLLFAVFNLWPINRNSVVKLVLSVLSLFILLLPSILCSKGFFHYWEWVLLIFENLKYELFHFFKRY
jgi:hypothetical protein